MRYQGQLGCGHDPQTLVVGLVQGARVVQVCVRPAPAVAIDAGCQDQVVVAPGDLERVELERAQPIHHPKHGRRDLPAARAAAPRGGARPGSGALSPGRSRLALVMGFRWYQDEFYRLGERCSMGKPNSTE